MNVLCNQLNEDLRNVQEWLQCNKLSLNVLKTHYMVFTPRNRLINDIDVKIHDVQIQRVYATNFLGVQIDAQLTWKTHIEYTCKKLSKCVGILCKARKILYKSTLISFYYSFAYPYFIYCNHVWGQNYPSCLERISLIQKKLVRIITCSPFRAHTEPLYFANKILNVSDINDYIIGIFMYECLYGNIPDIFRNYFQRNADVHDHNLRNANDLYVPYGRLDIRKFSIKIAGANLWNSLPSLVEKLTINSHIQEKYEALLNWEKKIYIKVWLTLCLPLRHVCVSERDQHPLWQWLVAYSVPGHCLNKCWLFINWTIGLWIKIWKFSLQKMDLENHLQNARHFA